MWEFWYITGEIQRKIDIYTFLLKNTPANFDKIIKKSKNVHKFTKNSWISWYNSEMRVIADFPSKKTRCQKLPSPRDYF